MDDGYFPIDCWPVMKTKKAVRVVLETDGRELWIPLSVIYEEDVELLEIGELVEINVKEWFYDAEIV